MPRAAFNWLLALVVLFGVARCSALGENFFNAARNKFRSLVVPHRSYHRRACEHLKAAYAARIAGQDAHLAHIAQTVCRHIKSDREKPLVLLISGPPGVGKTWSTRVTAQALYAAEPVLPTRCEPTRKPCEPFLQISSYSYFASNRQQRHSELLARIRKHVQAMPQSLIVFEDFDRFDCSLRDFIRDMIEYGSAHELEWTQSIIVLTSNVGASKAAQIAKDRSQNIDAWPEHEIQRMVEEQWRRSCRDNSTTDEQGMVGLAKMLKLVDRIIAFNALSLEDMRQVFHKLLLVENQVRESRRYSYSLPLHERLQLEWEDDVTEVLASHPMLGGYSGGFARQGASKCKETVEQMLDTLENVPCERDSLQQRFRLRKGQGTAQGGSTFNIDAACEDMAERPEQRTPRDSRDDL